MQVISRLAELTANQLIPYHSRFKNFSDKYHGRILTLTITDIDFSTHHMIHKSGICACESLQSDATIEMNIAAVLKYLGVKHPNASIIITGNQEFGFAASRMLSFNHIRFKNMLMQFSNPRLSVLIEEAIQQLYASSNYAKSELKELLKDILVNDAGFAYDRESNDLHFEKLMRLKTLIEELKLKYKS